MPAIGSTAGRYRPIMTELMSAVGGELPPDDGRWAFEPKWDGMRVAVRLDHGEVTARSRTDKDVLVAFPELLQLATIADDAVLDGELIATDRSGHESFGRLQRRFGVADPRRAARLAAEVPVCCVLFDLLEIDGLEAWRLPYQQRRQLLEGLVTPGPTWLVTPSQVGDGAALLQRARDEQREGIMAKRLDAPYARGRRSDAWRKVKIRHAQEFAVCGWTEGEGHRSTGVGALVLACRDNDRWRWVGNVGTGLTSAESERWRTELEADQVDVAPFEVAAGERALRRARWATPRHVVQVAYAEWTGDGRLRQPSLLGRRPDVHVDSVRCDE